MKTANWNQIVNDFETTNTQQNDQVPIQKEASEWRREQGHYQCPSGNVTKEQSSSK